MVAATTGDVDTRNMAARLVLVDGHEEHKTPRQFAH